jgi:hypothetical protein
MKFNFKKISAIASSVLLTGMTMGVAAAASFPAPFKAAGSSGTGIVYGSGADPMDATQANNIADYLAAQMPSAPTEGDYVLFDKGHIDHLTLGEEVTTIYPTLDDGELSTILAKGKYLNADNNEYDYTQEIDMGDLNVTVFRDTSFGYGPNIGVDLDNGDHLLNYTLDFNTAAAGGTSFANLENTNIEILGKTFFISDVTTGTASNGVKMTLLDSANTGVLNEGESTTLTVGGSPYEVSISIISGSGSSGTIKLLINGETTNTLSEGQTYKLEDGAYVGIKDIISQDYAGGIKQVEFSIGTGQIVIEGTPSSGQEVTINTDEVSDFEDENEYSYSVKAYITNTTTNIDQIVFEWNTDSKVWIVPGKELVMPGFDAVKISMGDFVVPSEEITTIKDSSDAIELTTVIKDGALVLPLLYTNDTLGGFNNTGASATQRLITNNTASPSIGLNETENTYFVATWISGNSAETYAFEIGKITEGTSSTNATELKNLVTGGSDVTIKEVGKTADYGQVTFTLVASDDDEGYADIKITPTGSGAVYADRVVTAAGMQMMLPIWDNDTFVAAENGWLNLTIEPSSWIMNLTEEDSNNNIAKGKSVAIPLAGQDGDGTEVTRASISGFNANADGLIETESGSKVYEGYVLSPLATHISVDDPSSGLAEATITYHDDDSYNQFYVAEIGASSGSADGGAMVFMDSEKSDWEDRDVVLVGGTCINSATADALGVAMGTCATDFTTATGVGSGQYLIQSVGDAFTSGKIALVVAGYTKDDTAAAASKLITSPSSVDTTAGKKYLGVLGTSGTSILSPAD